METTLQSLATFRKVNIAFCRAIEYLVWLKNWKDKRDTCLLFLVECYSLVHNASKTFAVMSPMIWSQTTKAILQHSLKSFENNKTTISPIKIQDYSVLSWHHQSNQTEQHDLCGVFVGLTESVRTSVLTLDWLRDLAIHRHHKKVASVTPEVEFIPPINKK